MRVTRLRTRRAPRRRREEGAPSTSARAHTVRPDRRGPNSYAPRPAAPRELARLSFGAPQTSRLYVSQHAVDGRRLGEYASRSSRPQHVGRGRRSDPTGIVPHVLRRGERHESPEAGPSSRAVPRSSGGFTPSTRLVSRNHGGGWFLFDFECIRTR